MPDVTPKTVKDYLAGLAEANAFEIEELRRTPIEVKLRQLWALMSSPDLYESETQRDASVSEIRKRWLRLYKSLGV